MASPTSRALREYYEQNTGLFLRLSGGHSTRSLHRPVWGRGVETREEAFAYPYRLVLEEMNEVAANASSEYDESEEDEYNPSLRVLDLGCGVGGGVHYLLHHFDGDLRATGVTLSPTQVKQAYQQAEEQGINPESYEFLEGDFQNLPKIEPVDVGYGIEAFSLAERPEKVFEQVATVLRPGGRLILIDDFFAEPPSDRYTSPRQNRWIQTVRDGWLARGLRSVGTVLQKAEKYNLRLVRNANLTPDLKLDRPRDRFIRWFVVPFRSLLWRWSYFRGLIGGDALQKCLREGILEYRQLVFERR